MKNQSCSAPHPTVHINFTSHGAILREPSSGFAQLPPPCCDEDKIYKANINTPCQLWHGNRAKIPMSHFAGYGLWWYCALYPGDMNKIIIVFLPGTCNASNRIGLTLAQLNTRAGSGQRWFSQLDYSREDGEGTGNCPPCWRSKYAHTPEIWFR